MLFRMLGLHVIAKSAAAILAAATDGSSLQSSLCCLNCYYRTDSVAATARVKFPHDCK
jgi:hypothetical protein